MGVLRASAEAALAVEEVREIVYEFPITELDARSVGGMVYLRTAMADADLANPALALTQALWASDDGGATWHPLRNATWYGGPDAPEQGSPGVGLDLMVLDYPRFGVRSTLVPNPRVVGRLLKMTLSVPPLAVDLLAEHVSTCKFCSEGAACDTRQNWLKCCGADLRKKVGPLPAVGVQLEVGTSNENPNALSDAVRMKAGR